MESTPYFEVCQDLSHFDKNEMLHTNHRRRKFLLVASFGAKLNTLQIAKATDLYSNKTSLSFLLICSLCVNFINISKNFDLVQLDRIRW